MGFAIRFISLFRIPFYDYVFIHREASPIGPPIFEWIIAKVFRKKIIFDFDDAIWLPNTSTENKIASSLKWHHKFKSICKWSYKISAGNEYLFEEAKKYNDEVFLIPTVVDTEEKYSKKEWKQSKDLILGWTGSHSTMEYLEEIIPWITELSEENEFKLLIISDQKPDFINNNPNLYEFRKWNAATEIEDLKRIDIGLMPLPDNQWTKGKCGFKLIQYHALAIPALASQVSPNEKIVLAEKSGYIFYDKNSFIKAFNEILSRKEELKEMGLAGRENIESNFSLKSINQHFLSLFS